jgi:hypothetical protein
LNALKTAVVVEILIPVVVATLVVEGLRNGLVSMLLQRWL